MILKTVLLALGVFAFIHNKEETVYPDVGLVRRHSHQDQAKNPEGWRTAHPLSGYFHILFLYIFESARSINILNKAGATS